jgi:type II secretory pathway pseudopilin PulG
LISKVVQQASLKMVVTMQTGKHSATYYFDQLNRATQNGFTMLAVLAAMFLSALAANTVMVNVSQQDTREREVQLMQVGALYRQAIKDYYDMSPGSEKQWPKTLNDLTYDARFVDVRRHLREVYLDPITRSDDWGLITIENGGRTGISGVYSKSTEQPLHTAAASFSGFEMPSASQYVERRFEYVPPAATPPASAGSPKAPI